MIDYEYDDGGRAAAGFKGTTGDHVIRATAIATGLPYAALYKRYAALNGARFGKITGKRNVHRDDYEPVLEELGYVKAVRPHRRKGVPSLTFSEAYEQYGDCIVRTSRHLSAIIDGVLRDTGDIRTYEWDHDEVRERKAVTIYHRVKPD